MLKHHPRATGVPGSWVWGYLQPGGAASPRGALGDAVGGGVLGLGAGDGPVPCLLAGLVVPPRRLVIDRQPLHRVCGQGLQETRGG